jgi:hypothetical protein
MRENRFIKKRRKKKKARSVDGRKKRKTLHFSTFFLGFYESIEKGFVTFRRGSLQ